MTLDEVTTPSELLNQRMLALTQGDFGLIYDSYHPEAPFLGHFPDRSEYLEFAQQQLLEIALVEWKTFGQREKQKGKVEILLWMRIGEGAAAQDLFELALLFQTEAGWRYHSAQKLTSEDYSGSIDEISFLVFDQAVQKIRF